MKPSDLVRYKPWPHIELHESGMVGIVLGSSLFHDYDDLGYDDLKTVDVLWDRDRPREQGPMWEYVSDLEVIK